MLKLIETPEGFGLLNFSLPVSSLFMCQMNKDVILSGLTICFTGNQMEKHFNPFSDLECEKLLLMNYNINKCDFCSLECQVYIVFLFSDYCNFLIVIKNVLF